MKVPGMLHGLMGMAAGAVMMGVVVVVMGAHGREIESIGV